MSLAAKYKAFLAHPTPGALASEHASLHYITTLTSIHEASAIIKHFTAQEKLLKTKEQKLLSAIESANALSVDVETTIEFVNGGGAYLPGLDDNFIADRTVVFPMVHMVHFDDEQKIVQIRMYWDQGALLKQVEVIGARARNWPIRDGKDQTRLISTSFASVAQPESAAASRTSTGARGPDEVSIAERPITSSRRNTNNAMNDPHATLNLFAPREANLEETSPSRPLAPRMQSAKPPPRDLSELFVGEDAASPSPANAASPEKRSGMAKAGAGKSYKANRLFEETEEDMAAATPMSSRKTNAKKYQHFEFGDGEDATPKATDSRTTKSRHASTWDFDDFVTPEKTKPKVLGQQVRHFGWSDDEDEGSPVRRPVVHKPRPTNETHFEFVDDGTPEGQRRKEPTKGRVGNKGMGLYQDHVLHYDDDEEDDSQGGDVRRSAHDISTHTKSDNRKKDFGAQWQATDDSPAHTGTKGSALTGNQEKVLKSMDANWGHEPSPKPRGINIAGNGMGGRKGTESSWGIYDESPEDENSGFKNNGRKTMANGMGGRNDDSAPAPVKSKGINIAGNGMGGRKGTGKGFDWDF